MLFGLLSVVSLLAFASRIINDWCRVNYETFTSTNYFSDESAMFMLFFWSGPLLMIGLLIFMLLLKQLWTMMVVIKRGKLREKYLRDNHANTKKE